MGALGPFLLPVLITAGKGTKASLSDSLNSRKTRVAAKLEQPVGWFSTRWKVSPGTVEVRTEEHSELVLGEIVEGGSLGKEVGTGLLQLSQPDFFA